MLQNGVWQIFSGNWAIYIPNNGSSIKFSELSDLSSADNSLIKDTKENKKEDEPPYGLCDAVKNSTT